MSEKEQQATKTCLDEPLMRFDANRQWNRRRQHQPRSFHLNTLQIWQISDFGWVFACQRSSREHSTNLAMELDMCKSSIEEI